MNPGRAKFFAGLLLAFRLFTPATEAATNDAFSAGLEAFNAGDFVEASRAFRDAATCQPAAGTFVNLGLVEWRSGRAGAAVLAWERALWIDPSNRAARQDLDFAREISSLDAPALKWHEAVSSRLPANHWAWIAGGSLWLALGLVAWPLIFRRRKTGWQQALAALGLGVFLLSLPAHVGIRARANIGFILDRNTSLRLTPTEDAEVVSTLSSGEPVQKIRRQGGFYLIRTASSTGWVEQAKVGFVCGDSESRPSRPAFR